MQTSLNSPLSSLGRIPNVVLIGTGWAIRVQLLAFRAAGLNVIGIWGREEEKAQKIASELKLTFGTSDFDSILERKDVDLISIVTPPFLHCEMTVKALKAGKHVICDKPTAMNEKEALEMWNVAKQFPSQLSILDHELRFLPSFLKFRELIREGRCGKLVRVEAVRLGNFKLNTKKWDWWSQERFGGGILGAIASHLFDSLLFFTDLKPISTFAHLQTIIQERENNSCDETKKVTSDDDCFVHLILEGNVPAMIRASAVFPGKDQFYFSVHGSSGVLTWVENEILWYSLQENNSKISSPESQLLFSDHLQKLEFPLNTPWGNGSFHLAKAIIDASLNNSKSLSEIAANFEDGCKVQAFLDKSRESNRIHQPVQF